MQVSTTGACLLTVRRAHLFSVDCAVEGNHVSTKHKQAMIGVNDADVFVVVVLVPVRHPLVSRKAPPFPACIAQVNTCQLDWSVHLRQVSHVGVGFVNLLYDVTTDFRALSFVRAIYIHTCIHAYNFQ